VLQKIAVQCFSLTESESDVTTLPMTEFGRAKKWKESTQPVAYY
jgi:hypothetical protein